MDKIQYRYYGRTHKGYNDTISFYYTDDDNNEFRFEFDINEKRDEKLIEYVENYDWEFTQQDLVKMMSSDWSNVPIYDDSYITSVKELLEHLEPKKSPFYTKEDMKEVK
jgi:hypothetical protein